MTAKQADKIIELLEEILDHLSHDTPTVHNVVHYGLHRSTAE